MIKKHLGLIASVVTATLMLAGCGTAHVHNDPPPAIVQPVPGSAVKQIRLTEQTVHRLGITTQAVHIAKARLDNRGRAHKIIPYSAVVYDSNGSTWAFVNVGPRTFMRESIAVAAIEGSTAILASGPPSGAQVVTVGAAELLGAEYNISGEE